MSNELVRTKSVLLYYFSGTGNSKRLAEEAARRFEEAGFKAKVKNIEDNKLAEKHNDYSYHGFVFPVICWGITPNMTKFMTSLPHAAGKAAFIIASLGAHDAALSSLWGVPPTEGKCLGQGKRILERRGYKIVGGDAVPMPLNEITAISAPPPEEVALIIEIGEKAVREFVDKIIDGEFYMKKTPWIWKFCGITLHPFMLWGMKYGIYLGFYVNDECNSCEICAITCPVENIKMVNGKPKWGNACVWCHRCLNLCPKESAQGIFIGTSSGRRRYKEPHLKVKDLIREKGREPVVHG